MRLGVLDVGSNTVHLLVVDAHRGAQPTPQLSRKSVLRLDGDPPSKQTVEKLRGHVADELAKPARKLLAGGEPDRVVATSKTFRTLARLAGAAPSSAGPRVARTLQINGLRQVIGFISRIAAADLAELEGVS